MGDKIDNQQLQQFAEFIVEKMDERFTEQDEKLAALDEKIGQQISVLVEDLDDRLARIVENIDSRIEFHTKPIKSEVGALRQDLSTIKIATKGANEDVRALDKAIGNVEHSVDMSLKFAEMSFTELRAQTRDPGDRVTRLEAKTA